MSSIHDLIAKLCPSGVCFKRLGDVARIKNGKDHKTLADGKYPVYGSGGIMRYANSYAYDKPSVLIPRKGSLDNLFFVDTPFWNVDTIFYTEIDEAQIYPKFFYYFLQTVGLGEMNQAGGVPSQTQSVLNEIKIPVPPIQIQAEIVRILDAMTAHTAELTAELTARKKQYNYFRDKLLSFEDGEVEWKKLGDILKTIKTGKLNANAMVDNGRYPFFTCDSKPFKIDTYAFDTEAIIVSGNGSQVGHINYYKGKFNAYQRTYILADCIKEMKIEFLLIYLKAYLRAYIMRHSKKGSVPYITMPMLENFLAPVPSIEKQIQIFSALSKFEILTESMIQGLPKEIELREKQYSYYRELLLNFKNPKEQPLWN